MCMPITPSRKAVNILHYRKSIPTLYSNYRSLSRVSTLAQRLASKCYFGDDMLEKCTVMGCLDNPALPLKELNDLKQKIFSLFLQFWGNPVQFEDNMDDLCQCHRPALQEKEKEEDRYPFINEHE